MSRLVTASLFGSINWAMNCPPSWKERAFTDLENTLNRIWTDPNPPAQRGIDFEKLVYKLLGNPNFKIVQLKSSDKFKEVLELCKGGKFQQKIKKIVEIDGEEYCLYGKTDVLFNEIIKDLKTTSNYKGKDHYLKSMQHKIYCYVTRISTFQYIIVEFLGDNSNIIEQVHKVDYFIEDTKSLEEEIKEEVRKVISFLEGDNSLLQAYLSKYSLY